MSRWILIGGAGLTGLKIAEDLIDRNIPNSKIIIADLKDSLEKVNINVKKVYCDISKNLLPRFDKDDIIIHLAARQYHLEIPKRNKLSWFREVNVKGTQNVINHCLKYKVRGLIFFSTDMVYGMPNFVPLTTNHPKNPIGPYGQSKLEAEELCFLARKKGLAVTILRPRLIMGKGRLGIMKKLFKSIFHNLPVPLVGNGKNCYQMVSVKDCSEATLLSVEKKIPKVTGIKRIGFSRAFITSSSMFFRLVVMLNRIATGLGICTLTEGNPVPSSTPHRVKVTGSEVSTHSVVASLLTETMYRFVLDGL